MLYSPGGVAGAFSVAFFWIVYNSPGDHPRISEEEKTFITKSSTGKSTEKLDHDGRKFPWYAILTSLPFWAIVVATCTSNWGDYVVTAMLPSYMTIVLGYNLSATGALVSFPFMVNFVAMIGSGYLTDLILRKRLMDTTKIRKINTVLGLVGPAVFLVLAVNIGCNISAAVIFFTISVGMAAFTAPGAKANPLDIAPPYSGTLWGIACGFANVAGLVSIQVAGWMLDIDDSVNQWKHIFWLSAVVYCSGAVLYVVFGSGVTQSWALEKHLTSEEQKDVNGNTEMAPLQV